MAINIDEIHNITTLTDAVTWINGETSTMFFGLILFAVLIVLIISLRRFGFAEAITLSSLVCFVMATIFGSIGFVHFSLIIIFFFLTLLGGLYLYYQRSKGA